MKMNYHLQINLFFSIYMSGDTAVAQGTQYIEHGFTFSEGQLKNIARAIKNKTSVGLRIESDQITGDHILLVTQTQLNKIKRNAEKGSGVVLTLSASQLKAIEKTRRDFATT